MGASGWSYFTSYQEEALKALRDLQLKEFVEEQYAPTWLYRDIPEEYWGELNRIWSRLNRFWFEKYGYKSSHRGFAQKLLEELANVLAQKHVSVELPEPPQTIEELLQRTDSDGTHTILDIERVAKQPGYRIATPLSRAELLAVFGTEQPTHEMVETSLEEHGGLEHMRSRWEAVYFTVYKDGVPDEICFSGHSGD